MPKPDYGVGITTTESLPAQTGLPTAEQILEDMETIQRLTDILTETEEEDNE